MHAQSVTRATKLTAADIDRLIAAKALPPGTHLAPPRTARPGPPSASEAFARLSPPEQAARLARTALPGGAPHQWLDTDRAALHSTEGCAAPADPREADVIAAFDVTVEPWHLPHTAGRANDGGAAMPAVWQRRATRPVTPMADAQDVAQLRGSEATQGARRRAHTASEALDALVSHASIGWLGWAAVAAWVGAIGLGIAISHVWRWGWAIPLGQ